MLAQSFLGFDYGRPSKSVCLLSSRPCRAEKFEGTCLVLLSLDTLFLHHALARTRRAPKPTTTCEFQVSLFLAFLVIKIVFHALDGISQNKTVVHLDPPLLDGIVDLRF